MHETSNIKYLSKELEDDMQQLLQNHSILFELLVKQAWTLFNKALFTSGLFGIMLALAFFRITDAAMNFFGEIWNWTSTSKLFMSSMALLLVGLVFAGLSRRFYRQSSRGITLIVDELKEDFQWLRKII